MVTFASYAFNKSHAAAYAVISYQTAYLKAHYPAEFMAALMTSMAGDARHTADYVRNCREMGIVLEPPSVVKSDKNFSTKDGRIRFGMLSVKNVGEGIIEAIIEGRKSVEGTHDIYEFVEAIDAGELNKKAIESLVRAGAFDDINPNRAQLMAVCDDAVQRAQKKAKQGSRAQISLFQLEDFADEAISSPELPKVADFGKDTKLAMEKEMLGVYLSGHPLDEYAALIRDHTSAGTAELTGGGEEFTAEGEDADSMVINTSGFKDGDSVIMAGMISSVRTMITRKSQEMARLVLEDFDGVIDAIVFPKVYERKRNLVKNDMIVGVLGRVSFKDESEAEILVEDIVPIENIASLSRGRGSDSYGYQGADNYAPEPARRAESRPAAPLSDPVKLRIPEEVLRAHETPRKLLMHLTDMFSICPGDRDVLVYLPGQKPVRCSADKRITFTDDLRSKLVRLLGAENVKG
jgi:DNA polymerase-3 subunit alpha